MNHFSYNTETKILTEVQSENNFNANAVVSKVVITKSVVEVVFQGTELDF